MRFGVEVKSELVVEVEVLLVCFRILLVDGLLQLLFCFRKIRAFDVLQRVVDVPDRKRRKKFWDSWDLMPGNRR